MTALFDSAGLKMKHFVLCKFRIRQTITELKQVIVDKIADIPLDMCANVCSSVTAHLRTYN